MYNSKWTKIGPIFPVSFIFQLCEGRLLSLDDSQQSKVLPLIIQLYFQFRVE